MANPASLISVYSGWDGYQTSLVRAVAPLTSGQLAFRLDPLPRSVGEIALHIAFGRLDWFSRMGAPGAPELHREAESLRLPGGEIAPDLTGNAGEIVGWLERGWAMIEDNMTRWTVDDLQTTYRHVYRGKAYAISRQWTIWRIMAHDIHHGGQLSILLGAQGIELPELGDNGGHIVEAPFEETP